MALVKRIPESQQAKSVGTILAIGTANPPNCINQEDYPHFYFKVTKSEHMTHLKEKFKRICEKSTIKKRYMHITEDLLTENPNIATYDSPSLNVRQEILVSEVPKLGKEASLKAIKEWGQPISHITHLIFSTSCGNKMPSADHELTKILGLSPSVKRFMMYQQGCFAGVAALRLAKDIAENNSHARVLVVCSENMTVCFRAPSENHLDILVGSAIFSDGAAAAIVGADPDLKIERPLFQLVTAAQTIIPNSDHGIVGHIREMGMAYYLAREIPNMVASNIVKCLADAVSPIGITDWNKLFYAVHPGGPVVLNGLEEKLGLKKEKLRASRTVLTEFGNMWGPSVFFILDEMRKKSMEEGKSSTGEGLDWGVLFGFGPGVTIETILLHSVAIDSNV